MVSKPRYFIKKGKKIPIYSHDRGVSFSTPSLIIRSQLLCDCVPPWCQWNWLKIEKKIWLSLQARETTLKCKVYNISHSMRVVFCFPFLWEYKFHHVFRLIQKFLVRFLYIFGCTYEWNYYSFFLFEGLNICNNFCFEVHWYFFGLCKKANLGFQMNT